MEPVARARGDGRRPDAGRAGALRLTLGRTTTDADVDDARRGDHGGRRDAARAHAAAAVTPMKVLVAMSGGVDSSVAAALLSRDGHDVVGVTMRLWGGESDTGCCCVADVDDARRVAQQLGIDHLVFNFTDDFDAARRRPVRRRPRRRHARRTRASSATGTSSSPGSRAGRRCSASTPSPPATTPASCAVDGRWRCARGADRGQGPELRRAHARPARRWPARCSRSATSTKAEVRPMAAELGLRTAAKPDSQDVCFITSTGGRARVPRAAASPFHPADVVDTAGTRLGAVAAVELVTVGQRQGLGLPGGGPKRFVVDVDRAGGDRRRRRRGRPAATTRSRSTASRGSTAPVDGDVLVQCSAHGEPAPATIDG